jgi:hypothetical protein
MELNAQLNQVRKQGAENSTGKEGIHNSKEDDPTTKK